MKVLDSAGLHVLQDVLVPQRPVEASVAVGCSGDFASSLQDDFALHVEARNHPLLEKDDLEILQKTSTTRKLNQTHNIAK